MKEVYQKIQEYFSIPRKVVITTHTNPDGDAIGSSLALYRYLLKKGHEVHVLVPNDYPSFLSWIPGIKDVLIFKHEEKKCRKVAFEADTICCLDFNGLQRMEKLADICKDKIWQRILIDHHPMPEVESFDLVLSQTQISSTSELVYDLITSIDGKDSISKEMAECIYVGVITDTGSFSYSCNYEQTYQVTAHLVSLGVDAERIHRLVYDTYSESRMRLLGYSLSERLRVFPEFSTAYIFLTKEDLNKFKFQIGDTEGIVNYALSIDGISLAVLFTEKEHHIRLSLRSKGSFSVNDLVRKHFEGGGHRNAAGGNSKKSMEETLKQFEEILPQIKNELASVQI